MDQLKNMKGITLIALVITIVVLLILAGVAIAMLTGDNGILTKAQSAKKVTADAEIEEKLRLAVTASKINVNNTIDTETLKIELNNQFGAEGTGWTKTEVDSNTWKVVVNGKSYKIDLTIGAIEKVTGIIVSATSSKVLAGKTATITATLDGIDKTGDISFTANPSSAATISDINQTAEGATATVTIASNATGSIDIEGKLDDEHKEKCTIKVVLDVTNATENSSLEVEIGSTLDIAKCITNIDSIEDFTITNVTGNATKENETTIKGTGTEDGAATITITGTQSGKTKNDITVTVIKPVEPEVGDFVNYSAGNWTQADLIKLGVEFDGEGNITNNGDLYAGSSLPTSSTPYAFGGFGLGQSKDQSITPKGSYTNTYSGWRVLSKNDDGTYNIIHAGTPEGYYHPNATNSAYKSQYILGGEASDEGSSTWGNYSAITQRDWSMYENTTYAQAGSARSVTYAEMSSLSISNTLRITGSYYWLLLANNSECLYFVDDEGDIWGGYNDCLGVRPVVSLKTNVTFTAKSGATTHTTKETAWQLGTK